MLKLNLNLPDFGLSESNLTHLDARTIIIKKWSWDYSLAHEFQKKSVEFVQEHPHVRILICCNHPRVFTNGRGLQKPKKGETLDLKEFKIDEHKNIPYPIHQIERGGGLTFHHPGQFIFYPILKLNPNQLSLSKMTNDIFKFSAEILDSWGLMDLSFEQKLMGLWKKDQKLASMGIAINKLVTFHGMALNIYQDNEMKQALRSLNPCGLDSNIYVSVEELIPIEQNIIEKFSDLFISKVSHGWK